MIVEWGDLCWACRSESCVCKRPTTAQAAAIRLAAVEPIRYYRGGWYCIPSQAGDDQECKPRDSATSVMPSTLRALVARGWLEWSRPDGIYSHRWSITETGKRVLDAHGAA